MSSLEMHPGSPPEAWGTEADATYYEDREQRQIAEAGCRRCDDVTKCVVCDGWVCLTHTPEAGERAGHVMHALCTFGAA